MFKIISVLKASCLSVTILTFRKVGFLFFGCKILGFKRVHDKGGSQKSPFFGIVGVEAAGLGLQQRILLCVHLPFVWIDSWCVWSVEATTGIARDSFVWNVDME